MSEGPAGEGPAGGVRRLTVAEPVVTPRLRLRGLEPADAAALHAYRSLASVARYVPFAPWSGEQIAERLRTGWSLRSLAADGDSVLLGYERIDTGELIGDISLFLTSTEHRGGEIGWLLHPGHSGRGYATEAAHAALHLMFDRLGLHRVTARVDARNRPSLALCERLGMRREAVLVENEWFKGEWSDEVGYALLQREWAARHASGGSGDGAICPASLTGG